MMQPEEQLLTRRQLVGMGVSRYQAAALTRQLPVVGKVGNSFRYRLSSILAATRDYLERRIQQKTRERMLELIKQLQSMLGNVVAPNFRNDGDPGVRRAMAKLKCAMAKTDRSMAQLEVRATQLKAEHGAPA